MFTERISQKSTMDISNNERFLNWIPPDKLITRDEQSIPKKRKRKIPMENVSHEEANTLRPHNKASKLQHSKNRSLNNDEKVVEYHRLESKHRKKDKLLPEDVEKFITSLPKYLRAPTQALALSLSSCRNHIEWKKTSIEKYQRDPTYVPHSAELKWKLSCPDILKDDPRFKILSDNCDNLIEKMQRGINYQITQTFLLTLEHARKKHINEFLTMTTRIAQCIIIYNKQIHQYSTEDHYSDELIAKVTLAKYIHLDDDAISTYLHCPTWKLYKYLQTHFKNELLEQTVANETHQLYEYTFSNSRDAMKISNSLLTTLTDIIPRVTYKFSADCAEDYNKEIAETVAEAWFQNSQLQPVKECADLQIKKDQVIC